MAESSDLGEVVAGLVEDMAIVKREFYDLRWQQVFDNFSQMNENIKLLHERLSAVEKKLDG